MPLVQFDPLLWRGLGRKRRWYWPYVRHVTGEPISGDVNGQSNALEPVMTLQGGRPKAYDAHVHEPRGKEE